MRRLLLIFLFLLSITRYSFSTDQLHDFLIIGKDTICLKTFPLEALGFEKRPFMYGSYDFPGTECWRGYQATWKVIGNKLFLIEIVKVNAPNEKVDVIKYFAENNYSPTIINGLIFADWFSLDLRSFPRDYKYQGCVWKSKASKQCRACVRFEKGVLVYNRYNGKR